MANTAEPAESLTLHRKASFAPATLNADDRTVEVIWSSGAGVPRSDWSGSYIEELSMKPKSVRLDRLNNGAPFLADHNGALDSVMGVVVPGSARITNGMGVATVRFAAAGISPAADKLFALVRDGVVQNISVGYRTYKAEKIEGDDPKVPILRATDWQPYELSAVAMGADDDAGFRSANFPSSSTPTKKHRSSKMDNEEQGRNDVAGAEIARVSGIRSACKKAGIGSDVEGRFISEGVSLADARGQVLDILAARSDAFEIQGHSTEGEYMGRVTGGESSAEKFQRGAVTALLHRAGRGHLIAAGQASKNPSVRSAFKDLDPLDDGGSMRALSLSDLARETLERRGVRTRMMGREAMLGVAMTRANGSNTQSDFAVLLENVMYKTLLGSYSLAQDTWRSFCRTDSVADFRASPRYRTGSFGVLDTLAEGGEFKNKSMPDGTKASITVETRGNIIALTREALVNDDMGALTDLANKFGRAAGLSIEKAVYDLLALNAGLGPTMADGFTLFHANHSNISTGAAISMAALEQDRVKMAQQVDISSNEILNLKPKVLVVPVGIGGEASAINRALYDPTAGSATQRPNVVGGLFDTVIDTARLTGTRRYLFADPSESGSIVVAFLNGVQAPFMDQQLGWRIDGTEWKVRLDFKAQAFDFRGAVTNLGV